MYTQFARGVASWRSSHVFASCENWLAMPGAVGVYVQGRGRNCGEGGEWASTSACMNAIQHHALLRAPVQAAGMLETSPTIMLLQSVGQQKRPRSARTRGGLQKISPGTQYLTLVADAKPLLMLGSARWSARFSCRATAGVQATSSLRSRQIEQLVQQEMGGGAHGSCNHQQANVKTRPLAARSTPSQDS